MHRLRLTLIPNNWWVMTGSNRRPSACKADALPAELITPRQEMRIIGITAYVSMRFQVLLGSLTDIAQPIKPCKLPP